MWFYATKVGGGVGSTLGTSCFVETLCGPLLGGCCCWGARWDVLERCGTIKSLEVTNLNRWIISDLFVICFFFFLNRNQESTFLHGKGGHDPMISYLRCDVLIAG